MLLIVLLVGDLMAPSGKGSSVSSESEGSNFFHAHDGDREGGGFSPFGESTAWRRKPRVDTAVRSEVML